MAVERINLLDIRTPGRAIEAFSTLRGDAIDPTDPYAGFNCCHYTADSEAHFTECRQALASDMGIDTERLIIPRQTHSSRVAMIDHIPVDAQSIEGVDAIVTSLPDVALCINTADCVPVVITDAEAGIIAAVHSGWRGTVDRITLRTLEAMKQHGARPDRIVAAMGPMICTECFEVGPEVAERFVAEFGEQTIDRSSPRPHVDLAKAVAITLMEGGVRQNNIIPPPACSRCNSDRFFSARRLGINSGRTLTAIIRRTGNERF